MHYIVWILLIAFVFMLSYSPRTGKLTKFFVSPVVDAPREAQSNSNSIEPSE